MDLELKLLIAKYYYYELDTSIISDPFYDILEKEYFKTNPDPHHWIGFDHNHPRSQEAIDIITQTPTITTIRNLYV